MKNNIGLIGWVLLAVVIVFGVLRGKNAADKLATLREANAVLTDRNDALEGQVKDAEQKVTEADARADTAEAEKIQAVEASNVRVAAAEAETDRSLAVLPDEVRRLAEPIIMAERAAHRAERDSMQAAYDRLDLLRLAQIAARDSLIARQREQIQVQSEIIVNLEDQVRTLDPPFFEGLLRDLPKIGLVAGCAGAGAALYRGSAELGAAVGATACSLAF